jgi:DNA polymerase-3 subunit epsilon
MADEVLAGELLRVIETSSDFRLLRRLELPAGHTGVGSRSGTGIGIALDVETTGLEPDDRIIELAVRRFRFDGDGIVVAIDEPFAWLEDPGRELPDDVVRLTGITPADVAGRVIDDDEVLRLLRSAQFVCAHNAGFDRKMVERRLPDAAGLAWACSCNDVDWRSSGFDGGRSLGWLLDQIGFFHGAHRAGDDVDAVIALLRHRLPHGRTALAEMLETAKSPTWRFRAVGAAFDLKDRLRARGYRWDADQRNWWRDVPDGLREQEDWWLAGQIYAIDAAPKALGPIVEHITWRERYA